MKRLLLVLSAIVMVGACKSEPSAPPATPPADARAFVVEFYAWYHPGPTATRDRDVDSALAQRRTAFAGPLVAALDSERACVARTEGICDLEADPFLASQDPCDRYDVGGSMMHGDTVGVSVFGVCGGTRDSVPAVIAMVVRQDSTWKFADFAYPSVHTSLAAMLQKPSR